MLCDNYWFHTSEFVINGVWQCMNVCDYWLLATACEGDKRRDLELYVPDRTFFVCMNSSPPSLCSA